MKAIKKFSVICTATSVRKTKLLSLKQDHGQPIRSFAAQVKGKAQVCDFTKDCTRQGCNQVVNYTEDIVKYVVISGLAEEDIKKDVLGSQDLDDKSLNKTISVIENKEMAVRALSNSLTSPISTGSSLSAIANDKKHLTAEVQKKLSMKGSCKVCNKHFQKFKMRYRKLKEFDQCIECWRYYQQCFV